MAGKKTGKRMLTWVLVLVMALSLLPLNVLAANGPGMDSGSGMIFTKKLVSDMPDKDGNYTIQMTAQATGTTTTTSKAVPMDIVLVLDQSGSMKDKFGKGTRQSAMKAAVNSFIGEVADKYSTDADHRMAIVTFGSDAANLVGWTAVNSTGAAALTSEINDLPKEPEGATNVGAGMQMAKNLMDSDAYTGDNTDRQKTVIVFTDGVPTTYSDFDTDVANAAISAAKDMKDAGVTIYTVGIFNGANPNQLYGDTGFSRNSNGAVGSNWSDFSFFQIGDIRSYDVPAGNRFLNYLSSNFENATGVGLKAYERTFLDIGYHGWEITENFKRTSSDYYMTAANASALNAIFKTFSDMVPTPSNDALNANTVITDTLSDYFTFATDKAADSVTVYAEYADGTVKQSEDATKAARDGVVVNGKTVTVTGYDFSAHHTTSSDPEKLVIEIKVKPSGDGCREEEIPTNKGNATVTLDNKEIDNATPPTVGGYSVEYVIDSATSSDASNGASWPNNGNGPATLYYPQGAAVPVTNSKPTLEGHEFTGWKSDIEGDGTVYTSDGTNSSITMPAADVTLTAQWEESKYKVTYALTDDVKPTGYNVPTDSGEYTKDSKYTVDPTHKEDEKVVDGGYTYTFSGWKLNGAGAVLTGEQTMGNESVVLKGTWTRTVNKYTVTYTDGVDGEEVFADQTYNVPFEDTITAFNGTPTRTGYTFTSWAWYKVEDGNDVKIAEPHTMPAYDLKAVAQWTADPIAVDLSQYVYKQYVQKYNRADTNATFTFTAEVYPKAEISSGSGSAVVLANPLIDTVKGEVKIDSSKNGEVKQVTFEKTDKLSAGWYYVYITENKGTNSYITYDNSGYVLNIRVFDNGKTGLEVNLIGIDKVKENGQMETTGDTTVTFVNTYTRAYHSSVTTPSKPTLNTGDHYAYVMGYPDGTVRPNGSITRAEVSAILFRLLSDKTRDEYFTTESSFTDVKAGAWYNNSIATLEKAGVIVDTAKGGAFRPNEAITRAELAAMLAQFSDAKPVKGVKFSDVSAEHWAYEAIAIAAKMGWIEGYPDGTFRPDATITRAEMMTLVNRALERVPSDEDHLLSKRVMLTFPDCKSGDWFYIAVQEATNSHTYERAATEKNGDEQWTALRANRDWTLLEK